MEVGQDESEGQDADDDEMSGLPPCPVEALPAIYRRVVREIAESCGCPVEIPFAALLAVAGAAIGRARGILIKRAWIEYPNFWVAIIARSGIGKSPAIRQVLKPVFQIERRRFEEYKARLAEHDAMIEKIKALPKADRPPMPEAPTYAQVYVDDYTTEALTDALSGNPKGVLVAPDELASLIFSMDKYAGSKGGDKARLLSSYDSGPWKVSRVTKARCNFIAKATVSILAGCQPKMLARVFSEDDKASGFWPRFVPIIAEPEEPPQWTDTEVSADTEACLQNLIETLAGFDFDSEGKKSRIIGCGTEAKALFAAWFNSLAAEPWQSLAAGQHEAASAKLRGQCLRACLILHVLQAVARGENEMESVSSATMADAITLADWVKAHQRAAWRLISKTQAEVSPVEMRVARAVTNLENQARRRIPSDC